MGNHRSGRRWSGISRPVLVTVLSVILVIAFAVVWIGLGDRIDEDSDSAASVCLEGPSEVVVRADPQLAPALATIAERYNATEPVVRDHCITVTVAPADARATLDALTAPEWDAEADGAFPAAWIPESSVWAAALREARPDAVQGVPESIASTPVRLAVEPAVAAAVGDELTWRNLPGLTVQNGLVPFGLTRSIRLSMPQTAQADAVALAGQAVAAATAESSGRLTAEQVQAPPVTGALNQLMLDDRDVGDTAQALAVIGDPATSGVPAVRAVPVTEQRLYVLTQGDETAKVTMVAPGGPTPLADFPVIVTGGGQAQAHWPLVIAELVAFAHEAEQTALLTDAGFHAGGSAPTAPATATVTFGEITDPLPVPDPAAAVAISAIVYPPATA